MKTLLLCLLILATIQSNGQAKTDSLNLLKFYSTTKSSEYAIHFLPSKPILYKVVIFNDTMYIKSVGDLKAIKIGDRVYKIESPRLTEVDKESPYIIWDGSKITPSPDYIAAPYKGLDTNFYKRKH